MTEKLGSFLKTFDLHGSVVGVEPFKSGHINDTYRGRVATPQGERWYIHQRINRHIFKDIPGVMRNIVAVTDHIRAALARGEGSPVEEAVQVVRTKAGETYAVDESGDFWRTYEFVPGAVSFDICAGPAQAEEAGRMVGKFQRYLRDFPARELVDPIPQFQNTALRFVHLEEAIREDRAGRLQEVVSEVDFARGQKGLTELLVEGINSGALPLRVTHGDPKLNNILFRQGTGQGICLVDLDTCMAGTVLYDFGDLVRCTAVRAAEDERDLGRVRCELDLFRGLTAGFLEIVADELIPAERALLATAPQAIVLTIGIRFLTDYLNGDTYFKIHRPQHNLDRARTQFALVRSLQRQADEMNAIVADLLSRLR
jgi:Ser/Thr protein kinase RdoA (MazF antagonist)